MLAVFKAVPVTLTLAGITGFILSVGMAVDANVLIFERFKEEVRAGPNDLRRGGCGGPPRVAGDPRLQHLDLHHLPGPGLRRSTVVKGFAITLGIGVLASLISSIVVTHNLLAIVLTAGGFRRPGLLGVDRARAV